MKDISVASGGSIPTIQTSAINNLNDEVNTLLIEPSTTFNNAVKMNGTLIGTSADFTSLQAENLYVSGNTTMIITYEAQSGNMIDLTVQDQTTLNKVTIQDSATFGTGFLSVTGPTSLQGTYATSLFLDGDLDVQGTTEMQSLSATTINAVSLQITDSSSFNNDLNIMGSTTTSGNSSIGGDVNIGGNVNIDGSASISTMSVDSTSFIFTGDATTLSSSLYVGGDSTTINQSSSLSTEKLMQLLITLSESSTFDNSLDVGGYMNVGGYMTYCR